MRRYISLYTLQAPPYLQSAIIMHFWHEKKSNVGDWWYTNQYFDPKLKYEKYKKRE